VDDQSLIPGSGRDLSLLMSRGVMGSAQDPIQRESRVLSPEQSMKLTTHFLVPRLGMPGPFPPFPLRLNEVVLN
jgi:hypothetical protein